MFRNLLIVTAVFGLGWGASFGAGAAWAKRAAPPPAQAAAIPGGQTAPAPGGQGGGQGAPSGQGAPVAGRATAGTVASVDGETLIVTGPNNQQIRVRVTEQTQILKQTAGTLADLTPGTRVTALPQGQPAADGSITAAALQVVPEGAAAFSALGAAGNQPGQQGQQGQQGQRPPGQQGQQGQR